MQGTGSSPGLRRSLKPRDSQEPQLLEARTREPALGEREESCSEQPRAAMVRTRRDGESPGERSPRAAMERSSRAAMEEPHAATERRAPAPRQRAAPTLPRLEETPFRASRDPAQPKASKYFFQKEKKKI